MGKKKENIIKRWYKLTNPSKSVWFAQILFYTIYTVLLSVITIFAARTINCMYNQDWKGAFINLGIELLTIVLRNISIHLEYKFYGIQHIIMRRNIAKKVYNKILFTEDSEIKRVSKEKIVNIALNNMANAAEFPDAVASFFAYSFQVVLTLIIVFLSNWTAGLIVACLGIVNFFVYYNINKKLGKILLKRNEYKDDLYISFRKVLEGKAVINEFKGQKKYEKVFLDGVNTHSKEYAKWYDVYSYKNNLYYAFWNIVVYAITAFLLFLVSKGNLDISIYLIIVPYLTTCTDKLNTLFDKTSALENMRVDVDRVNLILGLNEKQLIKYGKFNAETSGYNLGLIDVSYDAQGDDGGALHNVDISFKQGCINLIKGERGSGKRSVFNLLRRYIKPNSGKVLLDNLDLYYYNEKTFKNHIDYCASHPVFINGTIKENLLLKEKSFKKIKEICNQVGVAKYIEKLPNKYETEISEVKSKGTLFLLGLVRAVLSNSNILMIYEFPEDTPQTFKNSVIKFLTKHYEGKTVIVFSHSDEYDEIAGISYEIKNGRVKQTKVKNVKKST